MAVQSLTIDLKNNTSCLLVPQLVEGPSDNSGLPEMIQPGDTCSVVMKLDPSGREGNEIVAIMICNISGMGIVVMTVNCGFEGKNQYQATALGIPPASFGVSPDPSWPNSDPQATLTLTLQ